MSNLNYKKSIGAGFGGLFQAMIAQKPQNGALDALKIAQGESTINQNNASINKSNAEADKIKRREGDLLNEEFIRGVMKGFLPSASPDEKAYSIAQSLRITDDPQHLTSAYGDSLNQSYFDKSLTDPDFAYKFNTANAAKLGKIYSDVGSTGLVLDQSTGKQNTGNPVLFGKTTAKLDSEIKENDAQARQADSTVKLNNFKINEPDNIVGYVDGGMVLIDKKTGERTSVGDGVSAKPPVKLPVGALKQQQELVDTIGTVNDTNRRLLEIVNDIKLGNLDLSPSARAAALARKNANMATDNDLKVINAGAALEELRNASLRLNAGVQTDGDAQRAWNEIAANLSDSRVVLDRLTRIIQKNNDAVRLKKLQIDQIRQNFDQPQIQNYGDGDVNQNNNQARASKPQPSKSKVQFNLANSWVGKQNIRTEQDLNRVIRELKSKGWSRDEVKALLKNNGYE